jgi:O-6-methylguanine DNA methyltransferase
LQKPAVRNMSAGQLNAAMDLGDKIIKGDVDLVALDIRSLEARGGREKKYNKTTTEVPEVTQFKLPGDSAGQKRKKTFRADNNGAAHETTPKRRKSEKRQSTLPFTKPPHTSQLPPPPASEVAPTWSDLKPTLRKISTHPTLTPYRKRLYSTLCSVPRGRYTTYAAMSSFLDSSARAVGNGMRNNPLAPEVPCHRVLAADGSIGGFCGSWGKDGEYASKKIKLLRDEGVRFDGRGKVVGEPFRDFVDLSKSIP